VSFRVWTIPNGNYRIRIVPVNNWATIKTNPNLKLIWHVNPVVTKSSNPISNFISNLPHYSLLAAFFILAFLFIGYLSGYLNENYKIRNLSKILLLFSVAIIVCFVVFTALSVYYYNQGVQKYNEGIYNLERIKDELYLGNYDQSLELLDTAINDFYKAEDYFKTAQDFSLFLDSNTKTQIRNSIYKSEDMINNCYTLKNEIYELISLQHKESMLEKILKFIAYIVSII